MSFKYKHVACGGTFDRLHFGHEEFLKLSFKNGVKVTIGITSDQMAHINGKNSVQSLKNRIKELKNFLKKEGFLERTEILILNDIYGSTIWDKTIECLAVSDLTVRGGKLINKKRRELGFGPLPILRSPIIKSQDGKIISTTLIKKGLLNRKGVNYYSLLTAHKYFLLPDKLRKDLTKPFGKVYKKINIDLNEENLLVAVGDIVVRDLIARNITPNLSVVDFKTQRIPTFSKLADLGFEKNQTSHAVKNPPGTIQKSLILKINDFFAQKRKLPHVIKVIGEEDLAVLPVVLLAPLGTRVSYGLKGQGIVVLEVTEKKKELFLGILKKFEKN